MLNVYDGTLGMFFDKEKTAMILNKFIANHRGDNLAYEFDEGQTKLVILTGKYEDEKEIDYLTNPFVFKLLDGYEGLAIDLRPYMKSKVEDIISVKDSLRDKYNGNLELERAIFNLKFLDRETEWLIYTKQALVDSFGLIMSHVVSMLLFDKSIEDKVKIISKLHMLTMDDKEGSKERFEEYIHRLNKKDLTAMKYGDLQDFATVLKSKFESGDLVLPSRSIGSLVENIKVGIASERADGITPDLLIQALSRTFFSIDSKKLSIAMVEHMPTYIAVLINVMVEGINSKSSFRKIMDSNKRLVPAKETAVSLLDVYKKEVIN